MFPPRMDSKKVRVGEGDLIGRGNLECFLPHVGSLKDFHNKTILESSHNYNQALTMIVEELEARFIHLNPFMQKMFL